MGPSIFIVVIPAWASDAEWDEYDTLEAATQEGNRLRDHGDFEVWEVQRWTDDGWEYERSRKVA
jgi:hypothetical protein